MKNILKVLFIISALLITGCGKKDNNTKTDVTELSAYFLTDQVVQNISFEKFNIAKLEEYDYAISFNIVNKSDIVRYINKIGIKLYDLDFNIILDTYTTIDKNFDIDESYLVNISAIADLKDAYRVEYSIY